MAVPRKIKSTTDDQALVVQAEPPEFPEKHWHKLKRATLRLHLEGHQEPGAIARRLSIAYFPEHQQGPELIKKLRNIVRKWQRERDYLDALWRHSKEALEGEAPSILQGIAMKAKQGRVDAARLAFEITGQHSPKKDSSPTHVQVVFAGLPRPELPQGYDMDGEASEAESWPENTTHDETKSVPEKK